MTAVVDSSALFAYLYDDDRHNEAARSALQEAYQRGRLVTNGVVYAELAGDAGLDSRGNVDDFLSHVGIDLVQPSNEALAAAGTAYRTYLSRRGDGQQCPACGESFEIACPSCETDVTARQHLGPDFLIGAQAAVDADEIVTFDAGFYRSYFDVAVRP